MALHKLYRYIGVLAVLFTLALRVLSVAHAQVLLNSDCRTLAQIAAVDDNMSGRHVAGVLPEGWRDDSSWQKPITVTYSAVADGNRDVLRLESPNGFVQMQYRLPPQEARATYRISFAARSASLSSLSAAVRIRPAPYTALWQRDNGLARNWQVFGYTFQTRLESRPIALYLVLDGPGQADVRDIKLERLLPAAQEAADPTPQTRNILRTTRFPLGLQAGWCLSRQSNDETEAIVAADRSKIGPSGFASLSVKFLQASKLYSAPFDVRHGGSAYVASAYLRGDFHGQFLVLRDGQQIAQQPVNLSSADGWKRIEAPFKPAPFALRDQIALQGTGTCWLDALQVEEGDTARPYASGYPAEVSLALPSTATSCANIQFADEAPAVNYAVTGQVPGAHLVARVIDVYGGTRKLTPVALGSRPLTSGSLNAAAPLSKSYGPFRIEAWVESAQGARLSETNEIVFYRLRRPRFWGADAPESAFGAHLYSTYRKITMAKAIGMNWARLHGTGTRYAGWNYIEPEKGKWEFHDDKIMAYRKGHLMVLGMISTAPGWASSLGHAAQIEYYEPWTEPSDLSAWSNYVLTVVKRYKGVIHDYEVWNEPYDGSEFWQVYDASGKRVRSATDAQDYAGIMRAAYAAAKSVDPNVNILGFCAGGNPGNRPHHTAWNKGVADAGGLAACDTFSYHSYLNPMTGFAGDEVENSIHNALAPLADSPKALGKPVWMSEGNPLNDLLEKGFYNITDPNVLDSDSWDTANRVARYVVSTRAAGVSKIFLYNMDEAEGFRPDGNEWRTLVAADGSLDPSGAAFSTTAWLVDGLAFDRMLTLASGVYAYVFSGAGRTVAAISTAPGHAAYRLDPSAGDQALDLFGNPVKGQIKVDTNMLYLTSVKPAAALEKKLTAGSPARVSRARRS
ncbi:MAG: hypothetical protein P4L33_16050 [Capsulimonadaceae bacterium]|nr:hypothetical protein [Capsulimonadaceae bacterium]